LACIFCCNLEFPDVDIGIVGCNIVLDTCWIILEMIFLASYLTGAKSGLLTNDLAVTSDLAGTSKTRYNYNQMTTQNTQTTMKTTNIYMQN